MKKAFAALALIAAFSFNAVAQQATITVDASRVENHISPRMYASFVEMMGEDVKWGMTAEMVHDRSFEEAPNYLGLPAAWQLEPDERNDNVGAIRFMQTVDEAYPQTSMIGNAPQHSLRVTLAPEDITDTRRGLSQGRLSVVAGQRYNGYVWIKVAPQGGYSGDVTAALEEDNTDGETYAKATLASAGGDWRQYRFQLTPTKTDRFAKLTFLFGGKGSLYMDQVSLEPASAKDQVRADSEAMIAELHPSFMRWPGGNVAQDYHWQGGIGPRDLRPVWTNKAWSNAPEPDDLGTDEYLALCERLHIEPSITVNVEGNGATAEEAAAWVEYVNGPATSKYGAMRAANGHPAPYGVKQWELGNEIFGGWVRGHVTAEVYAQSAVRYAHAMRAVDPTIKLIAVGEGIMPQQDAWNSAVLKIAGPEINYLAIHDYTAGTQNAKEANPRAAMMARAGEFERGYRHTAELIAQLAPGRTIKQIVNEWNLFYDASTIQSMEGAVYAARMMDGFERDGDTVEANCISDLLNGWVGGVIQASRDRIYGTAQYYALQMYADHLGTDRLHAVVDSPELEPGVGSADAVATRSADGRRLFIKLSNADREHSVTAHIEVKAFPHRPDVQLDLLSASTPAQCNNFQNPAAVIPAERTIQCAGICTVALPPDSVAVFTFSRSVPPRGGPHL
jgi:alpha-N-arabinofuranosidase